MSTKKNLKTDLHDANTEATEKLESFFGENVGRVLETIDRSLLEPGFGGLEDVQGNVAADLSNQWMEELKALRDIGEIDRVPDAFIVRRCPDGSLFLKSVYLPKGLVLHGARVEVQPQVVALGADNFHDNDHHNDHHDDDYEERAPEQSAPRSIRRVKIPTDLPDEPRSSRSRRKQNIDPHPMAKTAQSGSSPDSGGSGRRALAFGAGGEVEVAE